jgi:L-cysteine:1D-myo-inositol 2-amino-2-deoxy-alpha-D-glucopyranoside ligase
MYVCGITPYDATHLGHAATFLGFDLAQRVWRDAGKDVRYVQNVTDVDDPLLQRATLTGEDWETLAHREIALFREDMTALRLLAPTEFPGAVETIPLVIEAIGQLLDSGAAYRLESDVYFAVHADAGFGTLAHLSDSAMITTFASRGGDPERLGKKHPLDCLLWRGAQPGEPSWPSPFGAGRPGWHIECTAIALRYLGIGFDVQGGGSDLAFPHHEMGAAEGQVLTGSAPFAQLYVHAGMVGLAGDKMSKSQGNLVLVSRLRAVGVEPMSIRLALLGHHYRSSWDWTDADLSTATARLHRWREALSQPDGPAADAMVEEVRESLARDLDAPAALRAVDRWADAQLADGGSLFGAPGVASRAMDALLGVAV